MPRWPTSALLAGLACAVFLSACGGGSTTTVIERTVTRPQESRGDELRRQFGIPTQRETEWEFGIRP